MMSTASGRLLPVDGLRAIAVLGVIWAHIWAFGFGTPQCLISVPGGKVIDLNKLASIGGTGVDLFFVVSGFCMHLAYTGREAGAPGFAQFVGRRWLRIAPAYYAAVAGTIVLERCWPGWREVISHLVFMQTTVPGTGHIAAPFWSLAVEWQFYLILPLLVRGIATAGFWPTTLALTAASVGFRAWSAILPPENRDYWSGQLPSRLVEFMCGIVVAHLYRKNLSIPWIIRGTRGCVIGLAVCCVGRLLMVKELSEGGGGSGAAYAASAPILAGGYGIVLWSVVSSSSWVGRIFSSRPAVVIGRYSYSMYLWHWIPCLEISRWFMSVAGSGTDILYLAFIISVGLIVLVASVSYSLLEAPYFRVRGQLLDARAIGALPINPCQRDVVADRIHGYSKR
jgi:peptidoglycan/LPS O-acetylase OafA/YrhL